MKPLKKFLIYFPVILVALQVIVNLYALIDRASYNAVGFYLNTFIGTNVFFGVFFGVFLVAFTFSFNFCAVSRWCAIGECLFALNYLIVQQDNLYNILFQVIVGVIALTITFRHFIRKFPLCKISLVHKFIACVFVTGSCQRGLIKWENDIESIVKKTPLHANSRNLRNYP